MLLALAWAASSVAVASATELPHYTDVRFAVQPDGHFAWTDITHESGMGVFDVAARSAVLDAAPFMPLPEGADTTEFVAHFVFPSLDMSVSLVPIEGGSSLKPIYDWDCMNYFYRQIKKNWYPGGCFLNASRPIVAFELGQTGIPSHIQVFRSSCIPRLDESAVKAIEASKGPQLPFDCLIRWTFDFSDWSKNTRNAVPKDLANELPVKLVDVSSNSAAKLNNEGVLQLLHGDRDKAAASFRQAIENDPAYEPARNNLRLLQYR
jgi:hypothetical protein